MSDIYSPRAKLCTEGDSPDGLGRSLLRRRLASSIEECKL